MKNILKASLFFALGLVAGCVITAFFMDKFHRMYKAELYAMELTDNAFFGRQLREGNAELVSKTYENAIPQYVLSIHADNELRSANMADLALATTKQFYVCTKTQVPMEIAEIINNVPEQPCEIVDP